TLRLQRVLLKFTCGFEVYKLVSLLLILHLLSSAASLLQLPTVTKMIFALLKAVALIKFGQQEALNTVGAVLLVMSG
ncbi:MAG: hypothetical protein Q4D12_06685, partial [Bacteroidales bacterium]|nr:hypothetical protein [Bacteroidales bacterium]